MKLHVKSQIVTYVNGRPSLHIHLGNVFIYCTKQLNHHLYIPFIVMYKQSNCVLYIYIYIYIIYSTAWGCGVGVGWGLLGVCGSAAVPCCGVWVALELSCFGNTAELAARGFP